MVSLDILSPDPFFRQAIVEQVMASMGGDEQELSGFGLISEALDAWKRRLPGLIIVDAETEELDRYVRDIGTLIQDSGMPVIWLLVGELQRSLHDVPIVEILGKPLRLGHLIARAQFYRRLRLKQQKTVMILGPWSIESCSREAEDSDSKEKIRLTDKEMDLLTYLFETGEQLSRETLLAEVWGYEGALDTHTLETHITGLRRKLERTDDKTRGSLFLVERGHYRLNPLWLTS